MLVQDERDALNAVDREVETGQTKLRVLMKKFGDNIDNMTKAKEEIHSLLSRSQTQAFLQVGRLWLLVHTAASNDNILMHDKKVCNGSKTET